MVLLLNGAKYQSIFVLRWSTHLFNHCWRHSIRPQQRKKMLYFCAFTLVPSDQWVQSSPFLHHKQSQHITATQVELVKRKVPNTEQHKVWRQRVSKAMISCRTHVLEATAWNETVNQIDSLQLRVKENTAASWEKLVLKQSKTTSMWVRLDLNFNLTLKVN